VNRSASKPPVLQGAFRPRRTPRQLDEVGQGASADLPIPEDLVEVGYISGAHGVRGWLKVQPHSSDAAALLAARVWWLTPRGSTQQPVSAKLIQAREHSGSVVAQFEGLTDRSMAEQFKGKVVAVRRADFPVADEDEFYWVDLIGASVVNLQDESLGKVDGLLDNGAQQILRVVASSPGGPQEERLIPFVKAHVHSVDAKAGRIVVDWGLDY
jgi:16S rRNA processing protein RimM